MPARFDKIRVYRNAAGVPATRRPVAGEPAGGGVAVPAWLTATGLLPMVRRQFDPVGGSPVIIGVPKEIKFKTKPEIALEQIRQAVQAHGSDELVYGLRPESLAFATQGLPGTLSMIEPTGPETYATVDTGAGKLTARVPGVLQAAVGDAVHLQWSPDQSHLFDRVSGVRVG